MHTQQELAEGFVHLIRLNVNPEDSVDLGRITTAICNMGGVPTQRGYAFPDALERSLALEALSDLFGSRYVDAIDVELAGA